MKNDWTIQDYQLIEKGNQVNCFPAIILMLFVIGIFIICYKFDFQIYEKYYLIRDNEKYLLLVDSLKIPELESKSHIYIQNKKYKYKIIDISSDYSNINGSISQSVYINIDNYKTEASISECFLLKENGTIFQMIIEFIKGGIG